MDAPYQDDPKLRNCCMPGRHMFAACTACLSALEGDHVDVGARSACSTGPGVDRGWDGNTADFSVTTTNYSIITAPNRDDPWVTYQLSEVHGDIAAVRPCLDGCKSANRLG